jgi:CheY-like chemotaxis protein
MRSGDHLLTLINDVLEMSKIEAGRTTLYETGFDLAAMIGTLEEMFRIRAETKSLNLLVDYGKTVPRHIRTDQNKLRQVLVNLLGNAIKFTTEGGVILRVRTVEPKVDRSKDTDDELEIIPPMRLIFEVEDTGAGIAPEEQEYLFTTFSQTSSGQQKQEGTGLGLAISRQFVHLMGGDIRLVHSAVDAGSVFQFDIRAPLADEAEVDTIHPLPRRVLGLAPGQITYRLLIVEDRWENRQVLVKLLEPFGFDVREAHNGQEGIDIYNTWEPHLIFMDMRMPVMDGYEATRRIKAITKKQKTTIVALTASAFEEDRGTVLSAGCDDFVRKPFQEATIFEVLTRHLGVQFIYDDSRISGYTGDGAPQSALDVNDFSRLPTDWVRDLRQAAVQGDTDLLSSLIEHIREEYPFLAEHLTTLTYDYHFEHILAATDHIHSDSSQEGDL